MLKFHTLCKGFKKACDNGYLMIAKCLHKFIKLYKIRTTHNNNYTSERILETYKWAFYLACMNGHLHVAKWLLKVTSIIHLSEHDNDNIVSEHDNDNIVSEHDNDNMVFYKTCEQGHLHVAKWLLSIKPDINVSAENELAFRWACKIGRAHV